MYWKLFSLNPCKISRKLPITERNYSNAAGATLLKSLSAVDILVWILQEFCHFFLKNTSKRLLRQRVPVSVLWLYISKYNGVFSTYLNMFSSKSSLLDAWLSTEYPSGKKLFKVLTFLNPLIKFVTWKWKLDHISILGPSLSESRILCQDHQFQVLYS